MRNIIRSNRLLTLLFQRIQNRPNLQKALSNFGWLMGDRVVRLGAGLVVGLAIARYLGPEQYGLLSFAVAFTGVFGAIGGLGLGGVTVRDLITKPNQSDDTLGTAFLLQFLGGLAAFILAMAVVNLLRPDDMSARILVALLGFPMVFRSTDVVKYWFESRVQSKHAVWVETGVFLLCAVVRFLLVFMEASLSAFAWAMFAESALVAILLILVYQLHGGDVRRWRVRWQRACSLFHDGWPLVFSGLAIALFMRVDQIMLAQMATDHAVGVYAAAVRICEIWNFIPVIIVASVFPAIISSKKSGDDRYYMRLQKLYDYLVLLALILSVTITYFADTIVNTLFGLEYHDAVHVLRVNVWGAVFVFFGVAWTSWTINEGYQRTIWKLHLLSLATNIALNFVLIPIYGPVGAAIATTISMSLGSAVFALLFRDQRQSVLMLWRSLNLLRWFRREYRIRG